MMRQLVDTCMQDNLLTCESEDSVHALRQFDPAAPAGSVQRERAVGHGVEEHFIMRNEISNCINTVSIKADSGIA